MANSTIKTAAIVRAGYEFQDLVGIETLIRFYREPHLYSWVMLEADGDSFGALDDVVAARADGTIDYIQVKFTVDSEEYALDWDWLLKKKPRGTSMLGKWSKSFARVQTLGPIHSSCLRTNRRPTKTFEMVMNGSRVDLCLLDVELRTRIEQECGGAGPANEFFNSFEFVSVPDDLYSLEAKIKLELVPSDLSPSGWNYFREQVRSWSIKRNVPPGGRILYKHLAQVITRQRSEPIRQEFLVPRGYAPPSEAFHNSFFKRVSNSETPVSVLWGSPGRGKSTYLSYLVTFLRRQGTAAIRHHYFLSGEDTADRISFSEISYSLISQLVERYPDSVPDNTDEASNLHDILACWFPPRTEPVRRIISIENRAM